jgi:N-acetylglucosamine kinase-like BadF-type ATPase
MPAMRRDSLVRLPAVLTSEQSRTDARYVMGVDGGATKTLAAVLDLREKQLHVCERGPSNQDAVGAEAAVQELLDAAKQALAHAGVEDGQLGAAVLAIAGTDTDSVERHVREHTDVWIVVNDVVAAWATATGGGPGVAAIAGTGSNVFGVSGEGEHTRTWRAGGWGHKLGDEGSGYWLGVQSIKAALRDREASGPPTALSDAVPEALGETSIEAVVARVYAEPALTKGEIAKIGIATARLAAQGDAVARELYERAAAELGEQIAAVIRQTGLQGDFPVGLIGSAFKAGPVYVEPLTRVIHECAPEARVGTVGMEPVGGSLLLAARACGNGDAIGAGELTALIRDAVPT